MIDRRRRRKVGREFVNHDAALPEPATGIEATKAHVCEDERRLTYLLFQLREETASLDEQVAAYLASPRGLFEPGRPSAAVLARP